MNANHVHVSVLSFLIFGAYYIIWGFFWRTLSARWAGNSVGQAMAYID